MSAVTEGLMIGIPIALVTLVVGSYIKGRMNDSSEATEETKEAHTETGKEHLVNNWGTIPVIGTDRGIMGGQAVGQNVN